MAPLICLERFARPELIQQHRDGRVGGVFAFTKTLFHALSQRGIVGCEFGDPKSGAKLCGDLRSFVPVRPIVRHHHERLDGSGYPDALRGDDIPLLAQIVGVVDAYDAMTTARPYRVARTREEAFAELRADVARGLFSGDLVGPFISVASTLNPTHG